LEEAEVRRLADRAWGNGEAVGVFMGIRLRLVGELSKSQLETYDRVVGRAVEAMTNEGKALSDWFPDVSPDDFVDFMSAEGASLGPALARVIHRTAEERRRLRLELNWSVFWGRFP
jgi:hypothetical protein